jgi:hypothetical protein
MRPVFEKGPVRRRWPWVVGQAAAGVVFAALVWYALARIGLLRVANTSDSLANRLDVATGALGVIAAAILLWPVAALAGGLVTASGILAVQLGFLGTNGDLANLDSPSLGFILLVGGMDPAFILLSGLWVGGGIILLVRERIRRRRRPEVTGPRPWRYGWRG